MIDVYLRIIIPFKNTFNVYLAIYTLGLQQQYCDLFGFAYFRFYIKQTHQSARARVAYIMELVLIICTFGGHKNRHKCTEQQKHEHALNYTAHRTSSFARRSAPRSTHIRD